MLKLKDSIQNFKRVEGEWIHETWNHFQKLLLQCQKYGVPDHLFLQYFYLSLHVVNKAIADNLVGGGLMKQTFARVTELLDQMTKIYKTWDTGVKT